MNASIVVADEANELGRLFEAELKQTINERASYAVENADGETTFTVTAKDVVALRATLNAITKQLVVHQKMKSVGNSNE